MIDKIRELMAAFGKIAKFIFTFVCGIFFGVLGSLSFLRTSWIDYHPDFFFWFSIVSTLFGVLFLVANAIQLALSVKDQDLIIKEKEIHKSQVKVWEHYAHGIQMGLFAASTANFSNVNDAKETMKAIQNGALYLTKSLNEERLFTDEEIKEKQIEQERENKELMQSLRKQ